MRYVLIGVSMMVFLVVSIAGFRGDLSRKPPLELFADMDRQPKLRPMEPNSFFENGISSQPLVKGTVRRSKVITTANGENVYPFQRSHYVVDGLNEDVNRAELAGRLMVDANMTLKAIPLRVNESFMKQGQKQYNITCAPCHGKQGNGGGMVANFGFDGVADLHAPEIIKMTDGLLYRVVTHGTVASKGGTIATARMKGYANTLSVEDRWAVVAYVRALQLSRLGQEADLPDAERGRLLKKNDE